VGLVKVVKNRIWLSGFALISACNPYSMQPEHSRLPAAHQRVTSSSTQFHSYRYPLRGLLPSAIASIDLFDRGVNDLVIANAGSSSISLYKNRGNGTFEHFAEIDSCPGGDSISAELLTGSGHYDILVTCNRASVLSLFSGNGQGGFVRHDMNVGAGPIGAQSAPHSGLSAPYLAVLHDAPAALELFYNHGNGSFIYRSDLAVPAAPTHFLADSFTSDGEISYAVVSQAESKFSIYLKSGANFDRSDYLAPEGANSIATVDLMGSGFNDLIVGSGTQNYFRIYKNDKSGHFPTFAEYSVPEGAPGGFGTSHLRGVAQPEVITQSSVTGDVIIYPHLGNGKLDSPEVIHAGSALTGMITGNFFHRSDDMDVAVIDTQTNELVVLLNELADY
jgi:hypothetical protein